MIVTDSDSFHEEWEVISDSDTDEGPYRSETFLSEQYIETATNGGLL